MLLVYGDQNTGTHSLDTPVRRNAINITNAIAD